MKIINTLLIASITLFLSCTTTQVSKEKDPVDYVNPYMGNISHLLVPTYPTIHLPNSMLRVYPERADFTGDMLNGLPLIVTSHRGRSAFNLSPYQGTQEGISHIIPYSYDNEKLTPYSYDVFLDDQLIHINYALSHQSAIYHIEYTQPDLPVYLILNSHNGAMRSEGNTVSGYQLLENNTKVYLFLESEQTPENTGVWNRNGIIENTTQAEGNNACVILGYGTGAKKLKLRYGISFISEEQAKANLRRELNDYNVTALAEKGRTIWNKELGKINIGEGNENNKIVFYTSLYRCFERPVCISEDGRYYSAFDGQVHNDEGIPFYTDDWIWDTYRATHPLRVLIDDKVEVDVINSYLRMAEQMGDMWMPTFPEITGDSRRMNSNHAVATVIDGYTKGLRGFDLAKAYMACKKGIEEKTLIPWSGAPAGWLDDFYKEHGYIPALYPGEKETVANVNSFEKRQPIAVTLGTAYDQWCLSRIAAALGLEDEAEHYRKKGYNYRNVYNPETGFFHPKDKEGRFIEPFDYRYDGGMGAREYYGENNGWVYRWDVPHNVADLINLMGGREQFIYNLNRTFNEPLGKGKYEFYAQMPDHTGNVGQFSMANEPSLHIPYLYNYAGQPWKTQKRIRTLLNQWFRNDLMGVPGDEDGGGMSAFIVFSSLGFYPVTPGIPTYNIGSPMFSHAKVNMSNGNTFEIIAENYSEENKYIQSATLNGIEWNKPWFAHDDIVNGGKLVLRMGNKANKAWGSDPGAAPPSAETIPYTSARNPFITHMYTADPSAHVWADGRLYVYASHDNTPPRGCDFMDKYHVFSTDDMVNWTDHGQILEAADVPWGGVLPNGGTFMWAPDCAYKDGKYYFYFPHPSGPEWNNSWKIGIAVSDKPASGFVCLDHWLIGLPDDGEIDPCVFVDDDGQAYFYYGGGGTCYGARLKENLIELDGELQQMEGLYDFHEAAWIHKRNGMYYLSYSDNHDDNWNDGVAGDNRMRYAISDNPLGPWEHKGIYMEPTNSYTNHGSIVEYKGQWYTFYHNSDLSERNGEFNDWLRSICVDKLYYNEDGTIQMVTQTK